MTNESPTVIIKMLVAALEAAPNGHTPVYPARCNVLVNPVVCNCWQAQRETALASAKAYLNPPPKPTPLFDLYKEGALK